MKQVIYKLTFEAFKRWADKHRYDAIDYDDWYQSLLSEAGREPKKLYAYEDLLGNVFFKSQEQEPAVSCERRHDLDIIYPIGVK